MVVLFHYSYFGPPPLDHPTDLLNRLYLWFHRFIVLGWSGVDLFFVLSGFLIGGILLDVKDSPSYYKTFYARRFYRILPVYYLWIFGYIVVMWTLRRFMIAYFVNPGEGPPDAGVFGLFAFVQNVTYTSSWTLGWAWLTPTWSLAVEEQFYVIAPLLIRRSSKKVLFGAMCAVVLAAPFLRMLVHFHLPIDPVSLDLAYTLMPCRADALAIGVLSALLWRSESFRLWLSGHLRILYGLIGLFCTGVLLLGWRSPSAFSLPMESVGYTWLGAFYGLVLVLVLARPSSIVASLTRMGWLRELGRVSYCVYLIHFAAAWFARALLDFFVARPSLWEWVASSCLSAVLVYVVARFSWRDIEYPLLRCGHAYEYESASDGAQFKTSETAYV